MRAGSFYFEQMKSVLLSDSLKELAELSAELSEINLDDVQNLKLETTRKVGRLRILCKIATSILAEQLAVKESPT